MKILSIGNSFSQDAHKWLHKLAKINGVDMETANLYIGGCSLETHWENMTENNKYYDLELNGNSADRRVSIAEALEMDEWDIVTLQQVSQLSGLPETYEPYLSSLANAVRAAQPNAKLYFHQTWAYEIDSEHEGFSNYSNDQRQMYDRVINTTEKAARSINAQIIPVGKTIQYLRENIADFDYEKGGLSLCRDGFHLSLDYGRLAAAATWFVTIIGRNIEVTEFEDFDLTLVKKIIAVVNRPEIAGV